jgi:hypothetical protein
MKYLKIIREMPALTLIAGGLFLSVSTAAQRIVTVSGTVVEDGTNQPIPQATVLLYASTSLTIDSNSVADILGKSKLDTATSGSDGKFSYTMEIASNAPVLLSGAFKQDYAIEYKIVFMMPTATTVNTGTFRLKKSADVAKDTLTVNGTVVDSTSGSPLSGCLIFMSGLAGMDTAGNTAITDANGAFSKQVIIGSSSLLKMLVYKAVKEEDGYTSKVGYQQYAANKQINLGTIQLQKQYTPILTNRRPNNSQLRETTGIYDISGKLLFAGSMHSMEAMQKRFPNNAVIIILTKTGKFTLMQKSVFLKY